MLLIGVPAEKLPESPTVREEKDTLCKELATLLRTNWPAFQRIIRGGDPDAKANLLMDTGENLIPIINKMNELGITEEEPEDVIQLTVSGGSDWNLPLGQRDDLVDRLSGFFLKLCEEEQESHKK